MLLADEQYVVQWLSQYGALQIGRASWRERVLSHV